MVVVGKSLKYVCIGGEEKKVHDALVHVIIALERVESRPVSYS